MNRRARSSAPYGRVSLRISRRARLEPRGQEPVPAVVLSDASEDLPDPALLRQSLLEDEPRREREIED